MLLLIAIFRDLIQINVQWTQSTTLQSQYIQSIEKLYHYKHFAYGISITDIAPYIQIPQSKIDKKLNNALLIITHGLFKRTTIDNRIQYSKSLFAKPLVVVVKKHLHIIRSSNLELRKPKGFLYDERKLLQNNQTQLLKTVLIVCVAHYVVGEIVSCIFIRKWLLQKTRKAAFKRHPK